MTAVKKSKDELDAEVKDGHKRLTKPTKVVALRQGYSDQIREEGDVFIMPAGTIVGPDDWFEVVSNDTATTAEIDEIDDMSVAEIKVELAKTYGITDYPSNKKADLVAQLSTARKAAEGADLA